MSGAGEIGVLRRELAQRTSELGSTSRLMQRVLDTFNGPVSYFDTDLRCRVANAAAVKTFGPDALPYVGRHLREIVGPSFYARVEPHVLAALNGERQRLEGEVTLADGSVQHRLGHWVPDFDDGKVVGLIVFAEDITEHVHSKRLTEGVNAELEQRVSERTAALRASEERFSRMFAHGPVAVVVRRVSDRRFVEVNEQDVYKRQLRA